MGTTLGTPRSEGSVLFLAGLAGQIGAKLDVVLIDRVHRVDDVFPSLRVCPVKSPPVGPERRPSDYRHARELRDRDFQGFGLLLDQVVGVVGEAQMDATDLVAPLVLATYV
jgi:hypothetical protein